MRQCVYGVYTEQTLCPRIEMIQGNLVGMFYIYKIRTFTSEAVVRAGFNIYSYYLKNILSAAVVVNTIRLECL